MIKVIGIILAAALFFSVYYFLNSRTLQAPADDISNQPNTESAEETVKTESANNGIEVGGSVDVEVSAPKTVAVSTANFAYGPGTVRIKAGDSVQWTNSDLAGHTVTADQGAFDSRSMSKGKTFTHTFSQKGTFEYHCALHPSMKGTVIVE